MLDVFNSLYCVKPYRNETLIDMRRVFLESELSFYVPFENKIFVEGSNFQNIHPSRLTSENVCKLLGPLEPNARMGELHQASSRKFGPIPRTGLRSDVINILFTSSAFLRRFRLNLVQFNSQSS